jgi:hypothetical protein
VTWLVTAVWVIVAVPLLPVLASVAVAVQVPGVVVGVYVKVITPLALVMPLKVVLGHAPAGDPLSVT